eukprot:GHVS01011486.1.p1 GENE.GHVS01011486.1~~GHVS01011486.1.p1  ORF type:complete len:852 (+),score=96.44 GHVS01011486.1:41-2596(+)
MRGEEDVVLRCVGASRLRQEAEYRQLRQDLYEATLQYSQGPEYQQAILFTAQHEPPELIPPPPSIPLATDHSKDPSSTPRRPQAGWFARLVSAVTKVIAHAESSPAATFRRLITTRARWPCSRDALVAFIGFVVGTTHVYRIPETAAMYGGIAFFIPFVICMLLFALPLVQLELCLGQVCQGGVAKSFYALSSRSGGLSLAVVALSLFSGWEVSKQVASNVFLCGSSFGKSVPWEILPPCDNFDDVESQCKLQEFCLWDNDACHSEYSRKTAAYVHKSLGFNVAAQDPFTGPDAETVNWRGSLLLIFCWVTVYVILSRGILFEGHFVSFAFLFFAVTSSVLFFILLSHNDAAAALQDFFVPPSNKFLNLVTQWTIWGRAMELALTSLLCCTGVVQAFASYTAMGNNLLGISCWGTVASIIISFIYCMIYYVGCFALGYKPSDFWLDDSDLAKQRFASVYGSWGGTLNKTEQATPAFLIYAQALATSQVPSVANVLFYFSMGSLLLLSMVIFSEAAVTVFCEARATCTLRRGFVAGVVVAVLGIASLVHTTGFGWAFAVWTKNFSTFFIVHIICLTQAIFAGWVQGASKQAEVLGSYKPIIIYGCVWLAATVCCAGLWRLSFLSHFGGKLFAAVSIFSAVVIVLFLSVRFCYPSPSTPSSLSFSSSVQPLSRKQILSCLALGNVDHLRRTFNSISRGSNSCVVSRLVTMWTIAIKYIVPVVSLLTLISNIITVSKQSVAVANEHSDNASLPTWWAVGSCLMGLLSFLSIAIGVIFPCLLSWIIPPSYCLWTVDDVGCLSRTDVSFPQPSHARLPWFFEGLKPAHKILQLDMGKPSQPEPPVNGIFSDIRQRP